jgi:hypothetical protein
LSPWEPEISPDAESAGRVGWKRHIVIIRSEVWLCTAPRDCVLHHVTVYCTTLPEHRVQWWCFVNTVMVILVPACWTVVEYSVSSRYYFKDHKRYLDPPRTMWPSVAASQANSLGTGRKIWSTSCLS